MRRMYFVLLLFKDGTYKEYRKSFTNYTLAKEFALEKFNDGGWDKDLLLDWIVGTEEV